MSRMVKKRVSSKSGERYSVILRYEYVGFGWELDDESMVLLEQLEVKEVM